MHFKLPCSALALALLPFALSAPVPCDEDKAAAEPAPSAAAAAAAPSTAPPKAPSKGALTAAQVLAVAPTSKSCDNAPAAGQCRTAEQAAPFIQNSFDAFGIISVGEKAAILSIMAYESVDFKFDKPGPGGPQTPGKGTRNMQSPAFNAKYAAQIPGLKGKVAAVANSPDGTRDLLTANDYYDFGSGAWFLATQCDDTIRSGLQKGDMAGWTAYIEKCVETTIDDKRKQGFQNALKALS